MVNINVCFLHSVNSRYHYLKAVRQFVSNKQYDDLNYVTELSSDSLLNKNTIKIIKENEINVLICDNSFSTDFLITEAISLSLQFPNLTYIVYHNDKDELFNLYSHIALIEKHKFTDGFDFIKHIHFAKLDLYKHINFNEIFENEEKQYLRMYVRLMLKVFKHISEETIKIKYNDKYFNSKQISMLINITKDIVNKDENESIDSRYKEIYFENTNEMWHIDSNVGEKRISLLEAVKKARQEGKMIEKIDDTIETKQVTKKELNKETMLSKISIKYNEVASKLKKIVIGQDHAINALVKGLYLAEMNSPSIDDSRTLATFFLFGPSGVGKTYLCENLANILGYEYLLLPMGEYALEDDSIGLIGSDPVFKNSRTGDLTTFIARNQRAPHIVVLDEIEKANQNVLKIFLHAIGSGVIKDLYACKDISLHNTILIFTSNIGKEIYESETRNLYTIPINTIIDAVKNEKDDKGNAKFSPEFSSRIMSNNPIIFNNLKPAALVKMAKNNIDDSCYIIKEKHDIKIKYDKRLPLVLLYHYASNDGRMISNKASYFIEKQIFALAKQANNIDLNKIKNININIDFSNCDKQIKDFLVRNKKVKVGVVADKKTIDRFINSDSKYEIIQIKNEYELKDCLSKNIVAYFVDPMYGGVKQKSLSITDYNTDGINLFYAITEKDYDVPVYILNKKEYNLTETDKSSLITDGARRVIDIDDIDEFNNRLVTILDNCYMEQQYNSLNQKGFVLDYKEQQVISKDLKDVNVRLYDFSKYAAYDAEASGIMLKSTDIPKTRFDDIIGCDMAKKELKYYINYLRNPLTFLENDEKQPKGILLYGPPGTGKTMLARAMAGEAQVNFISVAAAELIGNVSENKIKKLFLKARKYAPTVIFIDEIDAIGKKRDGSRFDSILTSLLIEMDGFKTSAKRPVFVLAATNYGVKNYNSNMSELDPALVRRFDNQIFVDLPNKENRIKYIELYLKKKKIKNIKLSTINTIANNTSGDSLAILDNILELAYRNAKRDEHKLDDLYLLSSFGEYKNGTLNIIDDKYRYELAIHEAGHAFVSYMFKDYPSYITIESRGQYGGYVSYEDSNDLSLTKTQLLNKICEALSGRIAEEEFFGKEKSLNTGSASDVKAASNIAMAIATKYAMLDELIYIPMENILNSTVANKYIEIVNKILIEQQSVTKKIIHDNKKIIDKIAKKLVEKSHLTSDELLKIINS